MAKSKATPKRRTPGGKVANPRVPRTRAGGEWTEARYFTFIRTALRDASYKRYPPLVRQALELVKRKSQNKENPRLKFEYQCRICGLWYARKVVRVDHIVPCGSLKKFSDLPGFVERLFCEPSGLQVLCVDCDLDRGGVDRGEEEGC